MNAQEVGDFSAGEMIGYGSDQRILEFQRSDATAAEKHIGAYRADNTPKHDELRFRRRPAGAVEGLGGNGLDQHTADPRDRLIVKLRQTRNLDGRARRTAERPSKGFSVGAMTSRTMSSTVVACVARSAAQISRSCRSISFIAIARNSEDLLEK
jgi:hypothetical protein